LYTGNPLMLVMFPFVGVIKHGSQSIQAALASVLSRRSKAIPLDDAMSDEDNSDDDWGSDDDECGGGYVGSIARYSGMQRICIY